jgi:mannose-6-phosphate isomerase-like protein (cupin superfamily)
MNHSTKPSFSQIGLRGYGFNLSNKDLEIYYVDVTLGHDTYITSKECFHIYYILDGEGTFDLNSAIVEVTKGDLVEVKPGIKYTYSGQMKLLLVMNPPWFEGNEEIHENNPNIR